MGLNPRFVGRVFRLVSRLKAEGYISVLIPDLWGESSDRMDDSNWYHWHVLIPDLWGESSDQYGKRANCNLIVLIPDLWGESSDNPPRACG